MLRFFEQSLDPFRKHDESMPPASLIGYYGRYCKQVWPFLVALMTISLVVSLIEVTILRFVGALVASCVRRAQMTRLRPTAASFSPCRSSFSLGVR